MQRALGAYLRAIWRQWGTLYTSEDEERLEREIRDGIAGELGYYPRDRVDLPIRVDATFWESPRVSAHMRAERHRHELVDRGRRMQQAAEHGRRLLLRERMARRNAPWQRLRCELALKVAGETMWRYRLECWRCDATERIDVADATGFVAMLRFKPAGWRFSSEGALLCPRHAGP